MDLTFNEKCSSGHLKITKKIIVEKVIYKDGFPVVWPASEHGIAVVVIKRYKLMREDFLSNSIKYSLLTKKYQKRRFFLVKTAINSKGND